MPRKLTPKSSLETLKGEAKRWLNALRRQDPGALARFRQRHPNPPASPRLRDVQLALAREHGFPGWAALKAELARRAAGEPVGTRQPALEDLLGAAERGDAHRVTTVLDRYPDLLNQRGTLPGHTGLRAALHFAMNRPGDPVVDLLLARGADPNVRDEGDNAMPLHFAAEKGHLSIVRKLIEHGADPIGAGDVHELTVIGWAVCFESAFHREVAEYLLAHGARQTIHSAVALGDQAAIRALAAADPSDLDRPMDRTSHHRTPLHLAVLKNQPGALAALLELGANPEIEDLAGLTPLDQAALAGKHAMADFFLTRGVRVRLPAAVALDRVADLQRLLREEPDALRPGGRWDRLIIRAAERAGGRVIEALIAAGASVQVRDDHRTAVDGTHGYTALHAAAFHGNREAVQVLLGHGASTLDRDDKYWGTPAGWAFYAGHEAIGRMLLEGPIDLFDAVRYDRLDRVPEILTRDPSALDRPFREYVNGDLTPRTWIDPAWTLLGFAVAQGNGEAVRLLLAAGANPAVTDSAGRTPAGIARAEGRDELAGLLERAVPVPRVRQPAGPEGIINDFLRWACLDWRVGGAWRVRLNRDADRLITAHPALARSNLYTAVVGGELELVGDLLAHQPGRANALGGPRSWPPLLYLGSARLASARANASAVAMAELLLDHGADPNAFYLGGNQDIHYTALTCVLGRGEELASMHPRARELTALLLERGGSPHDSQVLYNVFADNTSRHLLDDGIVWLLDLMYRHSLRRGHRADWDDPEWPMFDLRGAPSLGHQDRRTPGARFMLEAAVDRNLFGMAEWLLRHGAGPNTPPGNVWKEDRELSLYQMALARGHTEMAELLARYGAVRSSLRRDEMETFIDACLQGDRRRVETALARHPEFRTDHRSLFAAVRARNAAALALLLDAGGSPGIEDPAYPGQRALHLAAANGAVECAALLLRRGAEIDPRDSRYDGTPLSWAAWFGAGEMVGFLAEQSRDVWALTSAGQVDRLERVLEEEPGLARTTNSSDETLLMVLPDDPAEAKRAAAVLLAHGADRTVRNAQGWLAADLAERRGLTEVASVLRAG